MEYWCPLHSQPVKEEVDYWLCTAEDPDLGGEHGKTRLVMDATGEVHTRPPATNREGGSE